MHVFEFEGSDHFDFISDFSRQFGFKLVKDWLVLPSSFGTGYIRKISFDPDFKMLIHRYRLKEDFVIKRRPSSGPSDLISIFFYNNKEPFDFQYNKEAPIRFSKRNPAAVQITSNDIQSTAYFTAGEEVYFIVLGIQPGRLDQLLGSSDHGQLRDRIISNKRSFVYFESLTPEMERLTSHITETTPKETLSNLFFKIKVEELLYHLFTALLQRENKPQKDVGNADLKNLLLVRNSLLDLSKPPVIKTLSQLSAMSETRLKQLFRQTFGDSIYNYYQRSRMDEAAFMLKQTDLSVADVGFQLGFTNLSHFGRLFNKHYGMTPKRYRSVG